jgi:hypothetical protein
MSNFDYDLDREPHLFGKPLSSVASDSFNPRGFLRSIEIRRGSQLRAGMIVQWVLNILKAYRKSRAHFCNVGTVIGDIIIPIKLLVIAMHIFPSCMFLHTRYNQVS